MRKKVKGLVGICLVAALSVGSVGANAYGESAPTKVARASQKNNQIKSYGIMKEKIEKNNKKKDNKGNSSGRLWNQKMIQAEYISESEKAVKVAIIDSGVNYSDDINVVIRKNFIENDECSALYEDFCDHGTAVAGIIGARDNEIGITGINPDVEIYSARVLDDRMEAPCERIVAALEWAIENEVDIINMSFGVNQDVPEVHQLIKSAYEQGILLVAAAGNEDEVLFPAAYEEVISVGAINSLGNPIRVGTTKNVVELMAPGENILSSAVFDGVIGGSGTSLAAAHVTGVASVLMELNPDMPAEFIRALMDYSANLYGEKDVFGNGVVDLEYAIRITTSFKKIYEKYLRKSQQNETQRIKQRELFWGEIVKSIPENEKSLQVFSNQENVVGLWRGTGHEELTIYAENNMNVSFTSDQLRILKAGCKYPDKGNTTMAGMSANPYHGYVWLSANGNPHVESNYLANYIYLTRVAMNAGLTTGLSSVNGMNQIDRNRIDEDFANGKIGGLTYSEAFSIMGISDLDAFNTENRKLFIYGIAMHLVGDVYAHSTWIKNGTRAVRNKHHDDEVNNICEDDCCDNISWYPKRFEAAKQVMKNVIIKAYYKTEGLLQDFGISTGYYGVLSQQPGVYTGDSGSDPSVRYYLLNAKAYAQAVDPILYSEWARYGNSYYSSFQCADLFVNVSESDCILE